MIPAESTIPDLVGLAGEMLLANPDLRVGQAKFNALVELRPDLAERIRGTELDTYYSDDPERSANNFLWLCENW
jgi:hypothetical protein